MVRIIVFYLIFSDNIFDDFTETIPYTVVSGSGANIVKAVSIKCNSRRICYISGGTNKTSGAFCTIGDSKYVVHGMMSYPGFVTAASTADLNKVCFVYMSSQTRAISTMFSAAPTYAFYFSFAYVV